jgi:hypothetical protein
MYNGLRHLSDYPGDSPGIAIQQFRILPGGIVD